MVNGREFSWEELSAAINGRVIEGIQGIEYTTETAHYNIKGRGKGNVAISVGQDDCDGSITLLQSEVEAIQASVPPGGKITRLVFDVTVGYVPEVAGVPVFDRLLGCRIKKLTKAYKNSDGFMVCDLPLMIYDIQYQK